MVLTRSCEQQSSMGDPKEGTLHTRSLAYGTAICLTGGSSGNIAQCAYPRMLNRAKLTIRGS